MQHAQLGTNSKFRAGLASSKEIFSLAPVEEKWCPRTRDQNEQLFHLIALPFAVVIVVVDVFFCCILLLYFVVVVILIVFYCCCCCYCILLLFFFIIFC